MRHACFFGVTRLLACSLAYPLPFPLGPWPGWGVTVPALSVWGEVEAEVEPEEW